MGNDKEQEFLDLGARERKTDLRIVKVNGGRWGKNLSSVSFYNSGGSMVKHSTSQQSVANHRKNMIFKRYSIFYDYILEKENTHIPSRLLDSSFLNWDYIPKQG